MTNLTPDPGLLEPSSWMRTEALPGDASQRRYTRLFLVDGTTAILVEYPEDLHCRFGPDLEVLRWCGRIGLPVPAVLARDAASGKAMIEDLGPRDAEAVLANTAVSEREGLLLRLIQPLGALAATDVETLPPGNPPLDGSRMRWELAGFELWYLCHHRGRPPSPAAATWLDELARSIGHHPVRICHRDYHLNNILISDTGSVGIIDIQDILIGPDTYDVVSLLFERSATKLLPAATRRSLLAEWAQRTTAADGWAERARAVRLQRGLKVLGTFARFVAAGRSGYLPWLEELAEELAPVVDDAGAPAELTALLLD